MVNLNNIYNVDCINGLKNLCDNSIDCVVTSPPYNKRFFCNQKKSNQIWEKFNIDYLSYNDDMPIQEYEEWLIEVINLMLKKLKPNGSIFFNHKPIRHNNQIYHPLSFILRSNATIYQEIVWNRKNSPNIRNDILIPCTERIFWLTKGKPTVYREQLSKEFTSEVWDITVEQQKNHPAPFPLLLAKNCIQLSTKEGATVLDPFMGSGTTAVACVETGRNYIGFEISEEYCNMANNRIRDIPRDIFK